MSQELRPCTKTASLKDIPANTVAFPPTIFLFALALQHGTDFLFSPGRKFSLASNLYKTDFNMGVNSCKICFASIISLYPPCLPKGRFYTIYHPF